MIYNDKRLLVWFRPTCPVACCLWDALHTLIVSLTCFHPIRPGVVFCIFKKNLLTLPVNITYFSHSFNVGQNKTLVHLTFGTPFVTLHQPDHSWSFLVLLVHQFGTLRIFLPVFSTLGIFLSFLFGMAHARLRMPALRPASQAGPMCNPREGTSVVLRDTTRLTWWCVQCVVVARPLHIERCVGLREISGVERPCAMIFTLLGL